jgi:hypothetical protein
VLASPLAPAQEDDSVAQARAHFERALALVDANKHGEAAVEFRRAYEAKPHYSVLYNLGQAQLASGSYVEAYEALGAYLKEGGDRVPGKRRAELEAELARLVGRIGELHIAVEPADALVRVDGKPVVAGGEALRLEAGTHTVAASREGRLPLEREVTVAAGERAAVELVLEKMPVAEPAPARLEVRCKVPAVSVTVDGTPSATTPLSDAIRLAPGPHRILFSRAGYRDDEQAVTLGSDRDGTVTCGMLPLEPLPPSLAGTIEVEASEPGARCLVDGAPLPAGGLVPLGRHHVAVERAGFRTWEQDVEVPSGATLRLEAHLEPTADHAEATREGATTLRIVSYALGGTGIAVGAATVALAIWNDGRYGDWEEERQAIDGAFAGPSPDQDGLAQRSGDNDELLMSIQNVDKAAVGMAVGSGALLVAGVVLFLISDDPDRYGELEAVATADGWMIGYGGRW